MVIQSKRVWTAGQFIAAQLVIKDSVIQDVLSWGTLPADEDSKSHGAFGSAVVNGLIRFWTSVADIVCSVMSGSLIVMLPEFSAVVSIPVPMKSWMLS